MDLPGSTAEPTEAQKDESTSGGADPQPEEPAVLGSSRCHEERAQFHG